MKRYAIFAILLPCLLYPAPALSEGTWTNYTNTMTNIINDIALHGHCVWCATDGGVVCWNITDGEYTVFTTADGLLDIRIRSIAVGPDGDVWCGMFSRGVCHYDGNGWTAYPEPGKLNNPWEIAVGDNAKPWAGTYHMGLLHFNGQEWVQIEAAEDAFVYSLEFDSEGCLWAGFGVNWRDETGGGISVYDGTEIVKKYTTAHGLATNHINVIAVGDDGDAWCSCATGYIARFDGYSWTSWESSEIISEGWAVDIDIAPDGSVWFARSSPGGILRYDEGDTRLFTSGDGLAHDEVHSLQISDTGTIWVGTENGLSRFDGETWTTYRTDDIPGITQIYSIAAEENGVFWCGTNDAGVLRFESDDWTLYNTDNGLAHNRVFDVEVAPNGDVWFGTAAGISCFDGISWTTYTEDDGLIFDGVSCIDILPDGVLWIGTYGGGVSRFDGIQWTTYDTLDGLCGNDIRAIGHSSDGEIWIGTKYDGISRYDGHSWTTYTAEDGLLYNTVRAIAVDHEDHAWCAVQEYPRFKASPDKAEHGAVKPSGMFPGAVARFDGEEWSIYTHENGLAADWVEEIDVAPCGDVWFATRGESGFGVTRYDGESMTTYTMADGLASNQVQTLHAGPDGKVYFGTDTGLSVYTPPEPVAVHENNEPPSHFELLNNFPNPFNPNTTIPFTLSAAGHVSLSIYTIAGQRVSELANEYFPAGHHERVWSPDDAATGLYFYRIIAGHHVSTKKMLLVK